jgi:hypothetical protein
MESALASRAILAPRLKPVALASVLGLLDPF